jgi:hypothetical protein
MTHIWKNGSFRRIRWNWSKCFITPPSGRVSEARRHLAERQISERARSISKVCDILMELNTSLDFERGGEMSVRLSQLYGYMHRRLLAKLEANFRQRRRTSRRSGAGLR